MRLSCKCELGDAFNLWQRVFKDDGDFISEFLEFAEAHGRFYGLYSGKRLLSMLFMLDMPLSDGRKTYKGAYMYACATDERMRKKGLFSLLYRNAEQELRRNGYDCVYCVPQCGELIEFYSRLGFDGALCRSERIFSPNANEPRVGIRKASGERDCEKALKVYRAAPFLKPYRDPALFKAHLELSGCELYLFDGGYLAYDGQSVRETFFSPNASPDKAMQSAAAFFKKELVCGTLPGIWEDKPYAALKPLSDNFKNSFCGGYAGLLFD